MSTTLTFTGCTHFRQRIICSTLSGRSVKITDIRSDDEKPGLRDYEASFLRLVEKITNGSTIQINETGTAIKYIPGLIVGGSLSHECGLSRSIGYFLEALLCLAPFGKYPLDAILTGITNDDQDLTIDAIRTTTLPLLKRFGVGEEEPVQISVSRRGAPPNGGGMVIFKCPLVKTLSAVQLEDFGKVRRIRGIAYSTRVSPQFSNRVIDSSKSLLTKFTGDVYISSDHYKGTASGLSSGFGLTLVAETTSYCALVAESMAKPGELPEDLGLHVAKLMFEEILRQGCVDTSNQSIALLYMILAPEDVSKIRIGQLSEYTIQYIRHLKDFFGVMFKITPDPETKTIVFSCLGTGFKNLSKRVH
eukprot:TRINITY_DN3332_c0_g2_i1.p1 TRINITY_DN3332_c0_g2~~TRINITY_DN3332_c0_g2_i1.p1  ORF type:complete len:422 (-),score=68.49 TRINITY_DN3332_c0_g2_i1:38-1120(-)